jgi:hypothetical protein
MPIKKPITKKTVIIALVGLILIFSVVFYFLYWEHPERKFERYFYGLDLRGLPVDENSIKDYYLRIFLARVQYADVGRSNFTEDDIINSSKHIDKKFEELCKVEEKLDCPVERVMLWYYLNKKLRGTLKGSIEEAEKEVLENYKYNKALTLWAQHFNKNGIKEDELKEFVVLIPLLQKAGVLEKYSKKYIDAVINVEVSSPDVRERVHALFGKLYGLGLLLGIINEHEIGKNSYVRQNKILEKNCPLMPEKEAIKATDDPCVAYKYLRIRGICDGKPIDSVFLENQDLRYYFLDKRYDDVEKISCQLILISK